MLNNTYLYGSIYHMVHFRNVESIFHRCAILSLERLQSEGMTYSSIANDHVQRLRNRIYIWDDLQNQDHPLHSYVPFYFSKRTPMLYTLYCNSLQDEIVFFEINRSIILESGVVFSDGNVTTQQLSKYGSEIVLIKPATREDPVCRRYYSSDDPQGTNPNCSDIYNNSAFLEELDWQVIYSNKWGGDDERKRIKHAEVLVPDFVLFSKIVGISTLNQEKAYEVNKLIRKYGLECRLPDAMSQPDLYF